MRLFDLKQKEVINCKDCQIIGSVCDVDFDVKNGHIINIIIPGPCKICGLIGRDQEYIIPYACIVQVGDDVILVNVELDKCIRKCE